MSTKHAQDKTPESATSLVRAIHAAGAIDAGWPAVLEQLRRLFNARVVTLGYHEFSTGRESALVESPADAGFAEHLAPFAARNPWFLSTANYVAGRVLTGDELIGLGELRRTDFYHGFLEPRGLLHWLCGVAAQCATGAHLLSAYRTEEQGAFGARERAEFHTLLDHVTLALQSQWRWQEADEFARALLTLTQHDRRPVILTTADSEPLYRNSAADQLLEQARGLRLDGQRLVAASSGDRRLLRETIARLAQIDPAQPSAEAAVLTLAPPPPAPPVVAVVRPAGQVFSRQAGQRRGLVAVTVRADHARHDPTTCAFARQYALTVAQAKVSALIFAGQPLSSIARSLNVSENTVRSHLKQVFQKTNTHCQMNLVHLHARVCTSLS